MSLVKAKSKVKVDVTVTVKKRGRGRPSKNGNNPPLKKIKTRVESDEEEDEKANAKEGSEEQESFQQSFLITGGTLKGYQLEGVAWMATLWENGISGILGASNFGPQHFETEFCFCSADEMGLGKVRRLSSCLRLALITL